MRSLFWQVGELLARTLRPWVVRAEDALVRFRRRLDGILGVAGLEEPAGGEHDVGPEPGAPFALNDKEDRVMKVLVEQARPMGLGDLAHECFGGEDEERANSWVRNSLRRLLREGWVARATRGAYRATESGIEHLESGETS